MRRTVWAVTSGSYSDYNVTAIFENREDADEVAARHDDDVEEMVFYTAGDRSYRTTASFVATMKVRADGTFKDGLRVDRVESYRDDDGLLRRPTDVQQWTRDPNSDFLITVTSLAEDKAIKGVKDRAAEVAAMIVEGVDPREIIRGEPTESDIQADWANALMESATQTAAAKRRREAEEKLAAYRAQCKAESEVRVAVFNGDTQISVWMSFSAGFAQLPATFKDGDPVNGLSLRKDDGTILADSMTLSMLAGSANWAVIWPTTSYSWKDGKEI